jgi:hypothetical protein
MQRYAGGGAGENGSNTSGTAVDGGGAMTFSGTANTGGGGGANGASLVLPGSGGSGIVIVRYAI